MKIYSPAIVNTFFPPSELLWSENCTSLGRYFRNDPSKSWPWNVSWLGQNRVFLSKTGSFNHKVVQIHPFVAAYETRFRYLDGSPTQSTSGIIYSERTYWMNLGAQKSPKDNCLERAGILFLHRTNKESLTEWQKRSTPTTHEIKVITHTYFAVGKKYLGNASV